jgi:hypothetical protein
MLPLPQISSPQGYSPLKATQFDLTSKLIKIFVKRCIPHPIENFNICHILQVIDGLLIA